MEVDKGRRGPRSGDREGVGIEQFCAREQTTAGGMLVERSLERFAIPARPEAGTGRDPQVLQQIVAPEVTAPAQPPALAEDDPVATHAGILAVWRRPRMAVPARGYCPVLVDGAAPPAPPPDGAAEPGAPPDGAAEPVVPPDGEPEEGARVGPKVQPPPVFAWAEHACATIAAANRTASAIVDRVERLRMTARMSLVASRRTRGKGGARNSAQRPGRRLADRLGEDLVGGPDPGERAGARVPLRG